MTTYNYHKHLLFLCLRVLEGSAGQGKSNRKYLIDHIVRTLKSGYFNKRKK